MPVPRETINVLGGRKSNGEPVYEELLVDHVRGTRYRLVASPGIVLGIAAGDIIEINGPNDAFTIVERGRNLAIHVYTSADPSSLIHEVEALGGRHDGGVPNRLVVLTVPVTAGFAKVEDVLNSFVTRHAGTEWFYSNVYDPEDGVTPLNWWSR